MLLQAKNIKLDLINDNRTIIENFNYSAGIGDKTVIIGEEGNGKSTLLKFLYDEKLVSDYVSYSGQIVRKGVFGYLPQFLSAEDRNKTIYNFLKDVEIFNFHEYVNLLQLDYDMLLSDRIMNTLSGGEKIKIQLFNLLCKNPDILFLDEPSNDLDIESLSFLEDFIQKSTTPIIYVSHDETLVEKTANTIIYVEQLIKKTKCKITITNQTYADFLVANNLRYDRQMQIAMKERSEYKRKKERLQKLYEKARHNLSWKNPDGIASSDGRSKNSMKSIIARGKRMEFEADSFTEIPDREVGIIIYFDKRVSVPAQKRILSYSLKELRNNERILSKNIFLNVVGNEHICIIGQNGAGKSTLLKKLYNELKDRSDINVGYMPQNYADVIDYSMSPTEFFQSCFDKESCTKALTYMGNMKFTADEMFHPIGELSGGQIAKILFLDMVLRKCNVLLLDEPTRNFSPLSAPVIRNALINFNGTSISISHDRKYLDEVADTIYILNETGLQKI